MVKILIKKKIKNFNKVINVDGDKSISIRSLLIASQSYGVCKIKNLPKSEDILSTINGLKKLGIKIFFKKKTCFIHGNGLNGFKYKKNIIIDAGNSGTFARLLLGLLVRTPYEVKIIGDRSLSKRDFQRIIDPLNQFGAKFVSSNNKKLPLKILGSNYLRPINYFEKKGSAQCKSSVIFAALNTPGKTIINAKKSRNHTELFLKYLNLPLKVVSKKKIDLIEVFGEKQFKSFEYIVPGDISSSAFFIVLTALSQKSKLVIKNVNINETRIGILTILKKMGITIKLNNIKNYKNEKISDIYVQSSNSIKPINCPAKLNSGAIDEFLVIFLVAAKAKGISYFKNLDELNQKESPRLIWASKILNLIGIENIMTSNSLKIYGNPNLLLKKKILIKNFLKDHRVFMMSTIAALTFGGNWKIKDADSIKTSFPKFIKILRQLKR